MDSDQDTGLIITKMVILFKGIGSITKYKEMSVISLAMVLNIQDKFDIEQICMITYLRNIILIFIQ